MMDVKRGQLKSIHGSHQWINVNQHDRVENVSRFQSCIVYQSSPQKSLEANEERIQSKGNVDAEDPSLQHFDVQVQVNNGQLQPIVRYGVFSSPLITRPTTLKSTQSSQTTEPEMDMDNGEGRNRGHRNGYSEQNSGGRNPNDSSSSRQNQSNNGSNGSGGNDDGNGFNPNRNNNHSRRPDDGTDEDDDNVDDNETDENLARRLGFHPIDNETIRAIGRLRSLTAQRSFERRDLENLGYLIDELIRLQHLETFSQGQLEQIIHRLRLHRPLGSLSQALTFIEDRLPRRSSRVQQEGNPNVFRVWQERERRSRLDSKDSLEDEGTGQHPSGQQLRDVTEINHPTPPVILANKSKVKQMARDIDTRSVPIRTNDHVRSTSPSPITTTRIPVSSFDNFSNDNVFDERLTSRRNGSNGTSGDQQRVKQMVDRFEHSSTTNSQPTTKAPARSSYHDEHSDGGASVLSSSPVVKRVARREVYQTSVSNGDNGGFVIRHQSPDDDVFTRRNPSSNGVRFELDRGEIIRNSRRAASGTTMDEYVTSLLPGTETSVSMVRDVRARLYEDDTAVARTNADHIPMKLDVETLYILEQKSERRSLPSTTNQQILEYDHTRSSSSDRHDFAMQASIPSSTIKPPHRPVGTQVDSTVEQHNVGAQTTDTLHRLNRDRPRLPSPPLDLSTHDGELSEVRTTTTTTTRYEVKRRRSSHHSSEDEDDDAGGTVIYIDDKDDVEVKTDDHLPVVPDHQSSFGQVTSRIHIDQLRDLNQHIVRRHSDQQEIHQEEHRSSEVYEIHTRGACKCLVVSYEEKTQYGLETRSEKQLHQIERANTEEELRNTELHVIVTNSDQNYALVRRDYGAQQREIDIDQGKPSAITIHYYTKEGQRMRTEHGRRLEHLPLFIRCEIEYELNHYGSAQLIILSVTNADRRQMNNSLRKELVDEVIARSAGRWPAKSPELDSEISRQLSESISLLHLVDYSSRDDYAQTNSTDLRRVSRLDVTTSLRLVQRYRTVIHRLCQTHRSHLRLTPQAEHQRHLILVARDEYYLFDLTASRAATPVRTSEIRQHHQEIVNHQPFDYAKYRRETEAQQRLIEQRYRQRQTEQKRERHQGPPPPGHPSEAEFYLGSGRRALIEREINSMRESIRPHEHAPPRYKHEPKRRTVSISYSGAQRYVRARIIHVKDYFEEGHQHQPQDAKHAKEQELFVRVDDYINESAANSLRRSYSTDYLHEDGPRSRIRYIRIPGETIRIEEKTTYEYQGVMYANLPYSLRYWNILHILDREARQGRPLGATLPQVIVNDPYQTVIPPLTQQEIRQTAQQVLSPQYNNRSYTDQTLRWFLSRDNRTEVESAKYLQTLNQYRQQHEQNKRTAVRVEGNRQIGTANKYFVTETLVRYEKMPDRLVPISVPINDRAQSIDNLHHRSPSTSRVVQQSFQAENQQHRSQSQPRPPYSPALSVHTPSFRHQFPNTQTPLSRHQSVHDLHVPSHLSHPPSPSPSLHSLHNHQQQQQQHQQRRPVAFNTRFQPRPFSSQPLDPLFTEIIDSETGRRIVTTSQEQLPTEVRGLLNKYNLQQF